MGNFQANLYFWLIKKSMVKLSIIKNEYMSVYENECIILIKLSRISVLEN